MQNLKKILEEKELPRVAMDFMNTTHLEEVEIINELYTLILNYEKEPNEQNEASLNQKYEQWYQHTVQHFQTEETMMAEKNFPPFPIHKGEHDDTLAHMDRLYKNWLASKDIQILKEYIGTALPAWLQNHIQTMDTVTAMFFKTGNSPCSIQ